MSELVFMGHVLSEKGIGPEIVNLKQLQMQECQNRQVRFQVFWDFLTTADPLYLI